MLKNLSLGLVATLLALLLGECAIRIAVSVLHRHPSVQSDELTGWSGRPKLANVDISGNGGHFVLSTDDSGRREVYDHEVSDTSTHAPSVVFVGDSFVFGVGVSDHQTFAHRLAVARPDRRIVNLGVPGWGSDQEMLSLERFFSTSGVARVSDVVVLVYENDFRDVQRRIDPRLGYKKPLLRANGDSLQRMPFHVSLGARFMDHSMLAWIAETQTAGLRAPKNLDTDAGIDVVVSCVRAMRRIAEAHGARVHVLAHRLLTQQSTVSPTVWEDFLKRTEAIDITDSIRVGNGADPVGYDRAHWSAEGHSRVAQLILRAL